MMFYKKGSGEFLNLSSLLFVVSVIVLTVFSIFYAQWYSAKITGFFITPPGEIPELIEAPLQSSNSPPLVVIEEISANANQVLQSANYALSINAIITQTPSISEQDLVKYSQSIQAVLSHSIAVYNAISKIVEKYDSDRLDKDYISIVQSIGVISSVSDKINKILTEDVIVRQEEQQNIAEWTVERNKIVDNSVNLLENKIADIILLGPEEVSLGSSTNREPCGYPILIASFEENAVDFGNSGVDSSTGRVCKIKSQVVYDVSTVSSNIKSFTIPKVLFSPDVRPLIESRSLVAFHFEQRGETNRHENVGVVLLKDEHNLLNINFFSSPSYYDIDKKIYDFINDLFFKDRNVDSMSLQGMSVQEAELIVERNKSVPWVLWIVLFAMIVLFLFFGKFLVPNYNKMISSGKTAINKKDYSKAIKIYNEMTELDYLDNKIMKQDILDYLILLKKKIGDGKIGLILPKDSGGLPRISVFYSSHGLTNESSRVEKMIRDALRDVTDLPKVALIRMPIIAGDYKNLDSKSRENLAPLYESLVYKLRDLKS